MSAARSKLRDTIREAIAESAREFPTYAEAVENRGGIEREADALLAYDMLYGVRAIYKGRYATNSDEDVAVQDAIADARIALARLADALMRRRFPR